MNTITTTASTSTILAIDLGKFKCVACVHDPDTGEFRFTIFDTTRSKPRKLLTATRQGATRNAGEGAWRSASHDIRVKISPPPCRRPGGSLPHPGPR